MPVRLIAFIVTVSLASAVFGQDWNQWRGPNRDGYLPASLALIDALRRRVRRRWLFEPGRGG